MSFLYLPRQPPQWLLPLNHLRKQNTSTVLSLTLVTFLFISLFFTKCIQKVVYPLLSYLLFISSPSAVWLHLSSITLRQFFKNSSLWLNLLASSQIFLSVTFLVHLSSLTPFFYILLLWFPDQHTLLIFSPMFYPEIVMPHFVLSLILFFPVPELQLSC